MNNDVGLSIAEGVASGQTSQKEPSKRNIGLLLQATRGVPFSPVKINSMSDFNTIFGGQNSDFFGPAIVKSIFDEAGDAPVTLYLSRVVSSTAATATGNATIGTGITMSVSAGYKGSADPGLWGNSLKAVLYSYDSISKGNFALRIFQKGVQVEQFFAGSLAEIQNAVNKTSKYVTVTISGEIVKYVYDTITGTITANTTSNSVVGVGTSFLSTLAIGDVITDSTHKTIGTVTGITSDTVLTLTNRAMVNVTAGTFTKIHYSAFTADLSGGVDGTVVEADFYPVESLTNPKGLASFNGVDVQIIGCTEFHTLSLAKVLNVYLNGLQGPIGIINLPLTADEGVAELYATELQTSVTSFLAGGYLGWVKVLDELGNLIVIPAMGVILGAAYLRTPYNQGNYIHIPPGGIDSLFNTVKDVIPKNIAQPVINRLVQSFSCNIIQYEEGLGFYVGSSRTYSTSDLYQSIHIRQQTSFYKRALRTKLLKVGQKNNSPELKREALIELRSFFKTEYDNGALERSVPFETAYVGISDKSNNPSTQSRKILNINALYIPTECTEAVNIGLLRNDGVLTVTE